MFGRINQWQPIPSIYNITRRSVRKQGISNSILWFCRILSGIIAPIVPAEIWSVNDVWPGAVGDVPDVVSVIPNVVRVVDVIVVDAVVRRSISEVYAIFGIVADKVATYIVVS